MGSHKARLPLQRLEHTNQPVSYILAHQHNFNPAALLSLSDCGVNCHKHCKDVVGTECMKRFQLTSSSCPCTPGPISGLHNKGNSWSEFSYTNHDTVYSKAAGQYRKITPNRLIIAERDCPEEVYFAILTF